MATAAPENGVATYQNLHAKTRYCLASTAHAHKNEKRANGKMRGLRNEKEPTCYDAVSDRAAKRACYSARWHCQVVLARGLRQRHGRGRIRQYALRR